VAATARQTSTSKPAQTPWLSAAEKPGKLGFTPQFKVPRALMASIVLPAKAGVAKEPSNAKAAVASKGRWINFRMDFMD
jgi:hypothetical protein